MHISSIENMHDERMIEAIYQIWTEQPPQYVQTSTNIISCPGDIPSMFFMHHRFFSKMLTLSSR